MLKGPSFLCQSHLSYSRKQTSDCLLTQIYHINLINIVLSSSSEESLTIRG